MQIRGGAGLKDGLHLCGARAGNPTKSAPVPVIRSAAEDFADILMVSPAWSRAVIEFEREVLICLPAEEANFNLNGYCIKPSG